MIDFSHRAMVERYFEAIEAQLRLFVECGVTVDRMNLVYPRLGDAVLFVDGIQRARFTIGFRT